MCIFSGRVLSVSDTNIFARLSGRGTQFLIYSMKYSSDQPVAMILPLPVAAPEKRIGVRFINLKSYADFFNDMEHGFPRSDMLTGGGANISSVEGIPRPTIRVESVGDFIASYVPTLGDFDRLDPRFRLPRSVWNKIPAYADYGFAVFQLKANAASRVHPMAFEFHTRLPNTLYFPTVHIHDEQVHPSDSFDHSLYFQDPRARSGGGGPVQVSGPITAAQNMNTASVEPSRHSSRMMRGVRVDSFDSISASSGLAAGFVECNKTQGAVDQEGPCFKLTLRGELPNQDTLIRVG